MLSSMSMLSAGPLVRARFAMLAVALAALAVLAAVHGVQAAHLHLLADGCYPPVE